MRKLILAILLASAITAPAFADPNDDRGTRAKSEQSQNDRSERQAQRAERRAERQQINAQRQQVNVERQQVNVERQQQFATERANLAGRGGGNFQGNAQDRRQRFDNDRARFGGQDQGSIVQSERREPNVFRRDRNRTPVVSDVPRPGTQPRLRTDGRRWTDNHNWNGNWRHDNRYDWRRYRDHNRWRFHFGFYNDPFGWGYQPFSIGWRLWPNYYSRNYWINDPWQYRLPYPPPGTQWVRYYNDALLVDMYTGQVVDVIYSFFW
jgi:Ni/Co efflux regulator RcnB